MPLSSVVGAQSIFRPGVCTSTTRPASPYDGQVIYETDTDKTLVYNGTGWVFLSTSRANPGGLDFIKSQTIGSAVSSVEVTGAFSSTYDNYKIILSGGSATADGHLKMTLGSTSTGYYFAGISAAFAGGSAGVGSLQNAAYWEAGYHAGTSLFADLDLLSPFLSDETTFSTVRVRADTGGYTVATGGVLNNTTSYTAFTFTTSSGTMTGGTIRVYGYVNS